MAFFEYSGQHLATYAKPAGVPYEQASQFDHLSMHLPDEDALLRLHDRLKSHGCEVTDVIDHGFLRSIYFSDNNGIALEASWWTLDPTGRPVDYGDERLFSDPDPVPAVRELRERGELDHTVETQLVDEIIEDISTDRAASRLTAEAAEPASAGHDPGVAAAAADRDPDGCLAAHRRRPADLRGGPGRWSRRRRRVRGRRACGRGDLVLLTARYTPPYLMCWLALAAVGAVPLRPTRRAPPPSSRARRRRCGRGWSSIATAVRSARSTGLGWAPRRATARRRAASRSTSAPDDVAVLIPTSGTTGPLEAGDADAPRLRLGG